MKKIFLLTATALLAAFSCSAPRERNITTEELGKLSAAVQDTDGRFLEESIYAVALDSAAAFSLDTACTYFIHSGLPTDQKNSGRCWYFSTMNILRAEVMAREGWENFEFSETYGQFYDLLEKSNTRLESIIDHRHESIHSRWNDWAFKKPFGDGGHFSNAAHLVDKYGLVPQEVMPERYSSTDNLELMNLLRKLVRKYGLELRSARRSELSTIKETALKDIYQLLVAVLGTPPAEFEWMGESWTPATFRDRFVPQSLEDDYVVFMNDPTLPYYSTYRIPGNRNCREYPGWTFLNVPMEEIDSMGVASLAAGKMFYISADTVHDNLQDEGIYSLDSFRLDSLLHIDSSMSGRQLAESCEITSVHAIAVAGVKLDGAGRPEKWVIENSFGVSRGWNGYVVMTAPWLDTYLWRFVCERRFVPERLLRLYSRRPRRLPDWNPAY